jgi:hypothetical protein
MTDREVFLARAAEAREQASAATLDNVRDRCLRSEEAWMLMADRAARTEKMRATLLAAKSAAADNPDKNG